MKGMHIIQPLTTTPLQSSIIVIPSLSITKNRVAATTSAIQSASIHPLPPSIISSEIFTLDSQYNISVKFYFQIIPTEL